MSKKKTFIDWVKDHKTKLIIIGITALSATCLLLIYKSKKMNFNEAVCLISVPKLEPTPILNTFDSCGERANSNKIVAVCEFVRNLPNGQHPSPEKVAAATEKGLKLLDNQTLVAHHQRNYAA